MPASHLVLVGEEVDRALVKISDHSSQQIIRQGWYVPVKNLEKITNSPTGPIAYICFETDSLISCA